MNDATKARTLEAVYTAIHDALDCVSVEEVLRVGDVAVREWIEKKEGRVVVD